MELTKSDLHFVLTRLPKDVRVLAEKHGLFVGGGFIREVIAGNKPNDIDLFGPSKTVLHCAATELEKAREARKFATGNAITLVCAPRIPVQFITRWLFHTLDEVVNSFDFTVCQAAIGYIDGRWASAISRDFYPDLAARRLVYTRPVRDEAPGGSLMRVRKFLARGYSIQAGSLASVVAQLISKVEPSKLATGGNAGLAQVLTGLLREVDPLLVIDGVEAVEDHE